MRDRPGPCGEAADGGYTLVEVMVALLVTLVLSTVLYAVYLATVQGVAPWQRDVALQDQAFLLVHRLAHDLTYAEQLLPDETGWTLIPLAGPEVRYTCRDRVLLRNGRPMHEVALAVVDFRLSPSLGETRYALPGKVASGRDARSLLEVDLRLVLASRERTLVLGTTVAVRLQRPWPPLRMPPDVRP